jgi:hypothetical protein
MKNELILCLALVLSGGLFGCAISPSPISTNLPLEQKHFTKQDVLNFITPGKPFEEITNRFGQPKFVLDTTPHTVWLFRNDVPDEHLYWGDFGGFFLWTTNNKAVSWSSVEIGVQPGFISIWNQEKK